MIWLFIYDTWHVQNIHIICHILRIFALRYNVVCMQACSLLPKACGMCGMWHVVTTALWQAIRWVREKLWFMPKNHALFDHTAIALIVGIKISFKLYTHTHTHTHTRQMQNAKYIKAIVLASFHFFCNHRKPCSARMQCYSMIQNNNPCISYDEGHQQERTKHDPHSLTPECVGGYRVIQWGQLGLYTFGHIQ